MDGFQLDRSTRMTRNLSFSPSSHTLGPILSPILFHDSILPFIHLSLFDDRSGLFRLSNGFSLEEILMNGTLI